jgi:transposase
MRYVRPLTPEQREILEKIIKTDASFRARTRAHSLLLSDQGQTITDIAQTYQVHRVSVSSWISNWETWGVQGLYDQPRSGRPRKLNPQEQELAKQYLKEEPHSLKNVVDRLAKKTQKRINLSCDPQILHCGPKLAPANLSTFANDVKRLRAMACQFSKLFKHRV